MLQVFFETYGCQMNVAETDSLKALLIDYGYQEVLDPKDADFVIINTCSIRLTSEERIEGRMGFYRKLNQESDHPIRVVLTGCAAENIGPDLQARFPDVVALVWGTYGKERLLEELSKLSGLDAYLDHQTYQFLPAHPNSHFPFKGFLPISHGCNHFCTYCIVPHVRGTEVCRGFSEIVDNAKRLVEQGVVDIMLLGQNINSYKDPMNKTNRFPDLLAKVAEVPGIQRLSFLTSHPEDYSPQTTECIASYPNLLRYLHLPIQAGGNDVLKQMRRHYTKEQYLSIIEDIRKRIPDIVLSSDFMVGFPGETEEAFEDTLDVLRTVRFGEAFLYRYNVRPRTKAATYTNQIPESYKLKRLSQLIHLQRSILHEELHHWIGKEDSILLESTSKKNKSELLGKTHHNLSCIVPAPADHIGQIRRVRIHAVSGSALVGSLVS